MDVSERYFETLLPPSPWFEVDRDVLQVLHEHADARHEQKRDFESSRYWHEDSHFVGLVGEWLVSALTGRPYDARRRIEGDGGVDFPRTDVKTSTFVSDPHLKHLVNAKSWTDFYVLAVFDPSRAITRVGGWASAEMLRAGEIHDYGHGANFYLPEAVLYSGLPDVLLP